MFPLTIFLRRMWYNILYIRCRTSLKGEITVPLAGLMARVGRNPRSGIFTASVRSPAACVLQGKEDEEQKYIYRDLIDYMRDSYRDHLPSVCPLRQYFEVGFPE